VGYASTRVADLLFTLSGSISRASVSCISVRELGFTIGIGKISVSVRQSGTYLIYGYCDKGLAYTRVYSRKQTSYEVGSVSKVSLYLHLHHTFHYFIYSWNFAPGFQKFIMSSSSSTELEFVQLPFLRRNKYIPSPSTYSTNTSSQPLHPSPSQRSMSLLQPRSLPRHHGAWRGRRQSDIYDYG
jgi:hypothetical protein